MDRFSCGSKSTPQQGFPGFTPLHTAASDGGTPSAKLGLFKSASKDGRDGADGRSTPSPLPGGEGSAATLEQQQARLASLTPDSRAKAALQGALDLTPAAEGAKAGERTVVLDHLVCCRMPMMLQQVEVCELAQVCSWAAAGCAAVSVMHVVCVSQQVWVLPSNQ
jgi:hypothetical protein